MRGNPEDIFQGFSDPEMSFMQIVMLKEIDPTASVSFLAEKFLSRKDLPEELKAASRLCMLRLLDVGLDPGLIQTLKCRYPGLEILNQWRPTLPGKKAISMRPAGCSAIDFHQLVRSIHDMKELSSLTRTVYLVSSFFIPLTEKEWRSLWLTRTDELFFQRLLSAGMIEPNNGGFLLCSDSSKQAVLKRFLYDSYPLVRETVNRNTKVRLQEERHKRVKASELDRQALDMIRDGIICVDRSGVLYYMNPIAEQMLSENNELRERLLGSGSLEEALRKYSKEAALARIKASVQTEDDSVEIFGERVSVSTATKRFQVEFGDQIIILRDVTGQYLIDREIGSLYRHELKAALDVMGIGIENAGQLIDSGNLDEGKQCLKQIEEKRLDLFNMLEEKMDFIRLHSDAFRVRRNPLNLNLLVDKCVTNYKEPANAKKITIKSDHLHVEALFIQGEERFLVRAIDNILRNAVKFSAEKSEIKISLSNENYLASVKILDSGPGIPPENIGRVFQLGFTTNGSGRGLYLARRIVLAHGGRIEVKSKVGDGTCFTVRLPLAPESQND